MPTCSGGVLENPHSRTFPELDPQQAGPCPNQRPILVFPPFPCLIPTSGRVFQQNISHAKYLMKGKDMKQREELKGFFTEYSQSGSSGRKFPFLEKNILGIFFFPQPFDFPAAPSLLLWTAGINGAIVWEQRMFSQHTQERTG